MHIWRVLKNIWNHPLARSDRTGALARYACWQARCLLSEGDSIVPFVNQSRLSVRKGMHGATFNIYTGLSDFSAMGFLLHLLRPGDLFADVGANVGVYTVLASAVRGARSIAIEPIPGNFADLERNIELNRIASLVTPIRAAATSGSASARLKMVCLGPMSRIVRDSEQPEAIDVDAVQLDNVVPGTAILLKLDTEGHDAEVLDGATRLLSDPGLKAIIIELWKRESLHEMLVSHGFDAYAYDPCTRTLTRQGFKGQEDTVYVRDLRFVDRRVKEAPPFTVLGREI